MPNSSKLSARRLGFERAIEALRVAAEAGLITSALADKCHLSETTSKSYMRAMNSGGIVKIRQKSMGKGSPANCAVLIATQADIDRFFNSDLISKRRVPSIRKGKPQEERLTADSARHFHFAADDEKVVIRVGHKRIHPYADLPREFFQVRQVAA